MKPVYSPDWLWQSVARKDKGSRVGGIVCKPMTSPTYNWTRFWCPREEGYSLSDGGFLYDPESKYGGELNPHVRQFDQIAATPCLVLLGEPGIGKSHELERAKSSEEAAAKARGDMPLFFDLRAFSTDALLCSRMFDSAEFRAWQAGTCRLCLFLDSLDEGLLNIKTLAAFLAGGFGRCPIDRLSVRIACRTAEWPYSLEKDLKRLWGDANVAAFELVPLRRRDVRAAAGAEGVDAAQFLDAVETKYAVPLAIKPVTLRMLMNLFKKTGSFPAKQADLYEQGCQLLCEEPNEGRRDAGLRSPLSADALLTVASRIAAVTVFGNRYAVWTDVDQGDVPPEDVTFRQLAGGAEAVGTHKVEVTEAAIRAALKTGLFSSRGPRRLGWAHQTYAECLAARYVVASGMTPEQILSLIVHPDDPGQRLVPQLHETAAWIAGMRPDLFHAIMDRDPEVLLRSDVAAAELEDRKRLVDALLSLYAQEKFTLQSLDLQGHYHKLACTELADQLRPHVVDRNAHWLVRRVAIDIAEACKVEALVPELVRIALDQTEDAQVRKNAAYAVIRAGDAAAKAQLKPLALGQGGPDSNDDLKGCGLLTTWPDHMTIEELFRTLTPEKRPTYGGSYAWFRIGLKESLPARLQLTDLPFALDWVARGDDQGHDLEELAEWVVLTAWEAIGEKTELVQPFARAALARLCSHRPIARGSEERPFAQVVRQDAARRRSVLVAVMEAVAPQDETFLLVHTQTPLATDEDVTWLAGQVLASPPDKKDAWLSLINWVFNPNKPGHLDAAIWLCKKDPSLARAFPWLNAVVIESPQGRKLKAEFLKHKRRMARYEKLTHPPPLDPPPCQRVLMFLDQFESGNVNAWWRLNREMTLEPNSTHYGDNLEWSLMALPGWRDAEEPTRARIIAAAKHYVSNPPPMDQSWLGTNTLHLPACAGYRALAFLRAVDPVFLENLPADVWAAWAPIVIAFPLHNSSLQGEEPHTDLVRLAYEHAPDVILAALKTFWWESDRLDHCWDDRMAAVLLEKVSTPGMHINHVRSLLYQLLKHGYAPAVEYARSLVVIPQPLDAAARATIMAAAEVLLVHCPQSAWDRLWPAIRADSGFGRDLFEQAAHFHDERSSGLGARLAENEVADLYLWLAAQYPHKEDHHYEGAHFAGPRDSVVWFRDGLLQQLKNRGTPEACDQVRRIALELPHLEWLKWAVQEAEAHTRRQTWKPLEPQQIIALAQDRQRRYVENGRQLLDVLVDSLEHIQDALQGENPAAVELWDNRGDTRNPAWCPVDELRLSDWIARHLREHLSERGVVINREVQIRCDQATDIHVDAVAPGEQVQAASTVSAIIEVKGCWNGELDSAMETQLVGRYLKDNHCPNGLYLVGRFNCDRWSAVDYRKNDAPSYPLSEARTRFADQAKRLQGAAAMPGLVLRSVALNASLGERTEERARPAAAPQ